MSISLFCDKITVVDIAYFDQAEGLVGASYYANVEFVGKPDEEGILIDFSKAKKAVKALIDEICDHRFVIPKGLAQKNEGRFSLEYSYGSKQRNIYYEGPIEAICEIPSTYVSKDHIASFLELELNQFFGDSFDQVRLSLTNDVLPSSKPILSYTHGLKHHYGNCQRLFHGHHNSVDVWVNGENRPDLESWIVRDLLKTNIHFCIAENISNWDQVKNSLPEPGFGTPVELDLVKIEYTSSQGDFMAMLPGNMVYVLQNESTIENLSAHFASLVGKKLAQKSNIKVKAYEGIAKGAISYI